MKNKYLKLICAMTVIIPVVAGCASGPTDARGLYPGQWTIPEKVGDGVYLIQGYSTADSLSGAKAQCAITGTQFNMVQLTPSTANKRSTLTFNCK